MGCFAACIESIINIDCLPWSEMPITMVPESR